MPTRKNTGQERAVYTVAEIADIMGISIPTAYALVKTENFPSLRVGQRIVIPKEAFHNWLNKK